MVVEFLGGEEPAYSYMLRALKHGKTVVTANKVAFALHWHELQKAAKKSGAGLYYEAAVCAAIPIIHTLEESLQANRISSVLGIINGTTNYILSRMSREKADYETVLKDAQSLGLAEPDPSSDVEGLDAAYKLSILASMAFHGRGSVCRGLCGRHYQGDGGRYPLWRRTRLHLKTAGHRQTRRPERGNARASHLYPKRSSPGERERLL